VGGTRVGPAARQQYLQQMRDRYVVAGASDVFCFPQMCAATSSPAARAARAIGDTWLDLN
jgi:hypothetical protein